MALGITATTLAAPSAALALSPACASINANQKASSGNNTNNPAGIAGVYRVSANGATWDGNFSDFTKSFAVGEVISWSYATTQGTPYVHILHFDSTQSVLRADSTISRTVTSGSGSMTIATGQETDFVHVVVTDYPIDSAGSQSGPSEPSRRDTATSVTLSCSVPVGPPTQLQFQQQPTATAAGASISPAVSVRILDASGNLTSSTAAVTLAILNNPSSGILSGTATVNASSGVATFSGLNINKVGTNYTLSASSSGLSGATSNGFNITPGATSQFTVTAPSTATAGSAFNTLTVTAKDAGGNTTTGYSGTVHFTSTDGAAVLPANTTLTNGTGTFSATLNTVGARTITATDSVTGSITGTTGTITVAAPAPTAGAASANAAYSNGSPAVPTNIDLTASVTNATYVSPATQPAHGTLNVANGANAAGKTLIYTPTAGYRGADSFTYRAVAADGTTVSASAATVTVTVGDPTLTAAASGSGAAFGVPLSGYSVATTGGFGTRGCAAGATAPPAWLTVNADCSLTGTPAGSGTVSFGVDVTDQSTPAYTASNKPVSFTVAAATLNMTPAAGALPGATAGVSYSQAFTASAGTGPYTYAHTGTLPTGLTLTGATLSGTASAAGTFNFTITAADSTTAGNGGPYTVGQAYSITVGQGGQTITFGTLADASVSASPLTLSATASSGLAVAFSSTTTGVCTVSGVTLTLLTPGACTINADQAGDASWSAASTVSRTFTVTPGPLAITPGAASGLSVGGNYSQANPASGGVAPYTYSLGAGALVPGTSVDSATGVVSGVPTVAGSFSYIVRATDSQGTPATVDTPVITVTIAKGAQTLSFTSIAPSASVGGADYTVSATATSGLGATFTLDGTSTGCSISGATVSFTATGTCVINANQAGDANWNPALQVQQSFAVAPATLTINSAAASGMTVGVAYSQANTASGGVGPYSFTLNTGAFVPGTTLNAATGTVSGTPTAAGAFSYQVKASDSQGTPFTANGSTVNVTIAKGDQTVSFTSTAPSASVGGATYMVAATAVSGLTVTYTLDASSTGCSLTGATVSFTAVGTCVINADQAGDANWNAASRVQQSFAVAPGPLTITPDAASGLIVGGNYRQANPASGGVGPYTYSLGAGAFVPGVSVDSATGVVSGVPTVAGSFSYIVRATDSQGTPATVDTPVITVTIAKGAQTLSFTSTAPGASVGGPTYTVAASATSGLGATYTLDGTSTGCALSGSTVSFTATGTCVVNANQAGDSNWNAAPQVQQSFAIGAAGSITAAINFTPSTLVVGGTGTLTITFANPNTSASPNIVPLLTGTSLLTLSGAPGGTCGASGSAAGANFQFNGFAIPAGSCTVTLSYTGAVAGSSSGFMLGAFTPAGYPATPASNGNSIIVTPSVTSVAPPSGPVGQVVTISGTGFSTTPGNNTVSFGGGAGVVTGASATTLTVTAPVTGSGTVAVSVTVNGQTSTGGGSFTFIDKPIAADKTGVEVLFDSGGTAIDLSGSISGGPHTVIAIATTPAHGVATIAGDVVTYAPNSGYSGADSFTYTATGPGGTSAPATVSLTVSAQEIAPLALAPSAFADGVVGQAYASSFTATGGVAPYNYALGGGSLPDGLSLSVTGQLSGVPSTAGTYGFTIKVTDSATSLGMPATATQTYTLKVVAAPLVLAGGALADGQIGLAYTSGVSATGGVAPYSYALEGGSLPDGLSLSATGQLSGAPTTVGNYGFTIKVTDSATGMPAMATQAYTLKVVARLLSLTGGDAGGGLVGVAYSQTLSAAGGVAPYTYAVTSGALPAGLSLSSAGVLSGAPSAEGRYDFTLTVTDATGATASQAYGLVVGPTPPAPVITPPAPTTVTQPTGGGQSATAVVSLPATTSGVVTSYEIETPPNLGQATLVPPANGETEWKLVYTPSSTFMGAATVTVVAVGPGGKSAPASFVFRVLGKAPDLNATVLPNQPVVFEPTKSLTGGPFQTLRITRAPETGSATVVGLTIVYTANGTPSASAPASSARKGDGAQSVAMETTAVSAAPPSLDYVVVLSFGDSLPGRIDIQQVAGPTVTPLTSTTLAGRAVTVSLTAKATGGPFTAAQVVSVTSGAGSAAVVEGGAAGARTYDLVFTPQGTFTGEAVVTYRLSNAAASTQGVLTVTVTPRPDPSQDPEVRGVISAELDSARRFARSQTDNFHRRLEQVRRGGNGWSNSVRLNVSPDGPEQDPQAALRQQLGLPDRDGDSRLAAVPRALDSVAGLAAAAPVSASGAGRGMGQGGPSAVGVWTAGAIDWGRRDARGQRDYRFSTSGISGGVDWKLSDHLVVGVGAGYGLDRTKVGSNGSLSRGENHVGAVYGGWRGDGKLVIDGVLGYGSLDYDSRRWSADAGRMLVGERSGSVVFGSASVALEQTLKALSWSPYARIQFSSIELNRFTERGSDVYALNYRGLDSRSLSSVLGASFDWAAQRHTGTLAANLRFEWRHEFEGTSDQVVSYADWAASPDYVVGLERWARDSVSLTSGLEWRGVSGWRFGSDYTGELGSGLASHGLRLKVMKDF